MWQVLDGVIEKITEVLSGAMTLFAPDKVVLYGEMFELPEFQQRFYASAVNMIPHITAV